MATVSLTGTYRHHKNENYNDFLKALSKFLHTLVSITKHVHREFCLKIIIQGDPNQNLKFVLAITRKVCISDPICIGNAKICLRAL